MITFSQEKLLVGELTLPNKAVKAKKNGDFTENAIKEYKYIEECAISLNNALF